VNESARDPHAGSRAHVLSVRALAGTAAALLALTAITVALSRVDFGRVNVAVALGIATLKASLVAAFFMHLRHGPRFHLVILVASALFASLLVGFVLMDSTLYQPDIRAHEAAGAVRGR
jgi:cytochrome c oxidase subunit 4